MAIIPLSETRLGDVIQLNLSAYSTCTVYRINPDNSRQVWRPYVTVSDFEYTGGVIPYIGIEDFAIHYGTVNVVSRKEVK